MTVNPSDRSGAAGPLDGLRVLDASTVLAGPLAAQILGDYGADVVKIEHPAHGDPLRTQGELKDGIGLWWKILSRNKRSVGLYLGDSEGAAVFRELVKTADVLIENFRPGTLEGWGIGPDVLHEINSRLVIVRVTGFGQTGPYARRPGFGTLAEAMSGFAAVTGEATGPPTLPPFGLADSVCGLAAASAALMALYHRDVGSGAGQVIDMSILEAMIAVVGPYPTIYDQLGRIPKRNGNRSAYNAPRNTYRTKDGRWVAVSTSTQSIAERVMRLVGHPEVIDEPWFSSGYERALHADELDRYLAHWIGQCSKDEVIEAFERAEAAVAPVYDVAQLMDDPHIVERDVFTAVRDPDLGVVRMQNLLFRMGGTPGSIRSTGPRLGANTDAVLGEELGLDEGRLKALRARGIVR